MFVFKYADATLSTTRTVTDWNDNLENWKLCILKFHPDSNETRLELVRLAVSICVRFFWKITKKSYCLKEICGICFRFALFSSKNCNFYWINCWVIFSKLLICGENRLKSSERHTSCYPLWGILKNYWTVTVIKLSHKIYRISFWRTSMHRFSEIYICIIFEYIYWS